MSHDAPIPTITVRPEPGEDERAAIVAAVAAALTSQAAADSTEPDHTPSRWSRAGRTEATRPWSDQHTEPHPSRR